MSALDRLYEYLIGYHAANGSLPTQKQIACDLNKDRSVVSRQMSELAKLGILTVKYETVRYELNIGVDEE